MCGRLKINKTSAIKIKVKTTIETISNMSGSVTWSAVEVAAE
jgi:hypothetical protein